MLRLIVVWLLLVASPAWAIGKCGSGTRYTCVVDGDTFWLNGEKFRTFGYDTPEPDPRHGCGGQAERRLANNATRRFIQLWNSGSVNIKRVGGQDRYGRSLAVVLVNGTNIGDILISERLARRYPDGRKWWCN